LSQLPRQSYNPGYDFLTFAETFNRLGPSDRPYAWIQKGFSLNHGQTLLTKMDKFYLLHEKLKLMNVCHKKGIQTFFVFTFFAWHFPD
jgi:hypothetical protein